MALIQPSARAVQQPRFRPQLTLVEPPPPKKKKQTAARRHYVPLRLNRNFLNYPLARDARTPVKWTRGTQSGTFYAKLPSENRIRYSWPSDTPRRLRHLPTGFDMNVLFRLLAELQRPDHGPTRRVEFPSLTALLGDLAVSGHSRNRARLLDALALWQRLGIQHRKWYQRGQHVECNLAPPIERIEWRGAYGVAVTLHADWRRLAKASGWVKKPEGVGWELNTQGGYWCALPLPLPLSASAQNLALLMLTQPPNMVAEKMERKEDVDLAWLCRKIGLRGETARLAKITEQVNEWLAPRGGDLCLMVGSTDGVVKLGQVSFVMKKPRIPRWKGRTPDGATTPTGRTPDGAKMIRKTSRSDTRRGTNKKKKGVRREEEENDAAGAAPDCFAENAELIRYQTEEWNRRKQAARAEYTAWLAKQPA